MLHGINRSLMNPNDIDTILKRDAPFSFKLIQGQQIEVHIDATSGASAVLKELKKHLYYRHQRQQSLNVKLANRSHPELP